MATAEWGGLEWGAGEWGAADAPVEGLAAAGSLVLSGSASFTDFPNYIAAGTLLLSGAGALTTTVLLVAAGQLVLVGSAALRTARHAERLADCGDPISTACQTDWMPGA